MKDDPHEPQPLATLEPASPPDFDAYAPDAPCRRLFLSVLAETGRVSLACSYCKLTRQSANALRHRDPLFAAGWDAACALARGPLADDVSEQARDGVTDTLRRNGEVVAERHRFDTRLSMAVLHRLDKRCDRAEEIGAGHLGLVRQWDEFLTLLGKGQDQAAMALTENVQPETAQPQTAQPQTAQPETTQHRQLRQLSLGESPILSSSAGGAAARFPDPFDRFWWDNDKGWMTDFPPPAGFAGYERRPFAQDRDSYYNRACTDEEAALLDADAEEISDSDIAEDEALRDACLEELRQSLAARGRSPARAPDGRKKVAAARPKSSDRPSPLKQ